MKATDLIIKEQSFEILEQPDYQDKVEVLKFVEKLGRICYDSGDKITEDSYDKFLKNILKRGHLTVVEMATVAGMDKAYDGLYTVNEHNSAKFLDVKEKDDITYMVSNLRTALEFDYGDDLTPIEVLENVQWDKLLKNEDIPEDMRRHTVIFHTNRAMTHELVRHRPCSFLQRSQRYCRDGIEFILPAKYVGLDSKSPEMKLFKKSCKQSQTNYFSRLNDLGETPQVARGSLNNDVSTVLAVTASTSEWQHIFNLRCAKDADPQMQALMIPVRDEFIARGYIESNM